MAKLKDKVFRIAFGDILGRGFGVITTIYLARVLGAESFGLITVALSFLGYSIWFADLGLLNIGAREMAKAEENRAFRAGEIFLFKIVLGFVVLSFLQWIIPQLPIESLQKKIILSFSYALIPYAFLMEWYYNGKQFFGKVALSKIVNGLTYLVLVFFLVKSEADLESIPVLYTSALSASALILLLFSVRENPFKQKLRSFGIFKELFNSAFILGFGSFFSQVLQLLPPLAIGFFLSVKDAGIYGAAIRIIFIAMLLDKIFVNLLLPNLSSKWISNKALSTQNLNKVYRLLLVVGGICSLAIAVASPDIISLVYGNDYAESSGILAVLTILLFFTFQNSLFTFGLIAIGKDKEFLYSTIVSGSLTICIILLSANFGSLLTVAIVISISEILITLISFVWFSKFVNIKSIVPTFITLILGGALFYMSSIIQFPSYLEAIVALFIFIPMLFILKVCSIDDLKWIKEKLG